MTGGWVAPMAFVQGRKGREKKIPERVGKRPRKNGIEKV